MNSYIVSARKYRPVTFQSVMGQNSLITTLKNAIKNNKLSHAYLFCGPHGVGKTTCARIFAKTINCMQRKENGEACNECVSCQSFNENRSYNIYELDAASNNSVDNIRYLTDQIRIPPQIGPYKVYIIDEVHMLSISAFNAFLKTLEEPPNHAIFILATTEKYKIIPTILSRCQIYAFTRITINDIIENLEYIAQKENINTEKEALNIIAQKANGGMRDALSIFDQMVNFTSNNITYQSVIENLNILDYKYYFQLSSAIINSNISYSLLILNEIIKKGFDGKQIISNLADFFRDIMVCKDPQTIILLEISDTIKNQYLNISKQYTNDFLYKAIELSNEHAINYRYSINKRLIIELLFIRLCQLYHQYPIKNNKKKIIITSFSTEEKNKSLQQKQMLSSKEKNIIELPNSITLPKINKSNFSKKKLNNQNTDNKTNSLQQISLQTKIIQQDLEIAWKQYLLYKEPNIHLKYDILNIVPQVLSNNHIVIMVFNVEQLDQLNIRKNEIKNFLSQKFQNSQIELDIHLTDDKQKYYSTYTNKEKFDLFAKKNPILINLVKTFNLKY